MEVLPAITHDAALIPLPVSILLRVALITVIFTRRDADKHLHRTFIIEIHF